jgi:YD repeat-containing protein
MKKWIFFISLLPASLSMFAQTDLGAMGPSRIIPPNPEAARIASYGQYHISPNTGKPGIEVPIYTIKTPRLQVPVSLNYEATGVRVDQLASWVGTGWVLNAGGMITRVVVGLPDEGNGGYLSQTSLPTTPPTDPNYYANVCYYHLAETEPDKYYFNFNGKSGEFSYDANKNIFQTVASGLKITSTGNGFRILDDEGNAYDFTTAEYAQATVDDMTDFLPYSPSCWWLTTITSADGQDVINFTYENDQQEVEYKSTYSAAYGPTYSMEDIDLEGDQGAVKSEGNLLDLSTAVMMREWNPVRLRTISFKNGRLDFNRINDRQDGGSSRLASVDIYSSLKGVYTKQKSVQLLTDYFYYSGTYWNSQIYYSNLTGKYRLKLTGVQNLDALGNVIGKYSFQYDMTHELPFRGSLQQDYWGYFNGAFINDENHTTLPLMTTDDLLHTIGGADRTADETSMKAGVLTKIVYPTGGYTQFDWEAHRYYDDQTNVATYTPGVSAIGVNVPYSSTTFTVSNYDSHAKINVDINAYGWPNAPLYDNPDWVDSAEEVRPFVNLIENATGKSVFSFRMTNLPGYFYQDFPVTLNAGTYTLIVENFINLPNAMTVSTVTWHGNTTNPIVRLAGGLRIAGIENYNYDNTLAFKESYRYGANETGYGNLSVAPAYMNILSYNKQFDYWWSNSYPDAVGCSPSVVTRKLYKAEPVPSLALASGSAVVYPVVTKYYGDEQNNTGKTIYHFADYPEVGVEPEIPFQLQGEYLVMHWPWRIPVVERQEDYSKTSAGYTLVKDTYNNYTELSLGTVPVMKLGFYDNNIALACYPVPMSIDHYYINSYTINKGVLQLSSSTVKEYSPDGSLAMQTDKTFAYENQYNCFLASQTLTNSRGEVLKTVNKYPFNKDQITGLSTTNSQAIDQLVTKNILSPVIESQTFRNTDLVTGKRTNYRIWDAAQNIVRPENVQFQTGAAPLESRLTYGDYDARGNLTQEAKTGDLWTSYIYDYGAAYAVAEVKNATDQDMAYTSFEADGNGGWTVPGAVTPGAGITGIQYYNLTGGACSKTGLNPSTTYRLSYWSKGGAYQVTGGISQKTGRVVNGWTYYEHLLTGVSTVSVTGGAAIDELRVCPAGALMTTYTYDPLNGLTSQCDENNRITYYEYDTMGRLRDVKDQDGNVIKTIDYHYRGQ